MDQIVGNIPLNHLWKPNGEETNERGEYLSIQALFEILNSSSFEFAIADCGLPLKWIDKKDSFDFWKSEVNTRLADPSKPIDLDDYPSNYAYLASKWTDKDGIVILLEKYH